MLNVSKTPSSPVKPPEAVGPFPRTNGVAMTDLGAKGFQPFAKKNAMPLGSGWEGPPVSDSYRNGKGWERSGEKLVPMNVGRFLGLEPACRRQALNERKY